MVNKHLQTVDEQYEPPVRGSSGDGGGDSFGERLARLETRIEYLATKEDVSEVKVQISEVKVLIEKKLNWLLYGIVGMLVTSMVGLISALIRLW